jgi:GT2 family glycosyltransferase
MNYSCYVISNKPHLFLPIQKSASPEKINYFDGTGYESFSKLVNTCVASADTETVIIMSDKVMPTASDISKVLDLLDQGYAFVALYRLAFFGFKKELMRQVGMFDERFVGGGYEDDDFYIRLKEANLGCYITEEVDYAKSKSSWNYSLSRGHFHNKWGVDTKYSGIATRNISEETYNNYNLGPAIKVKYLSWDDSVIAASRVKKYREIIIK